MNRCPGTQSIFVNASGVRIHAEIAGRADSGLPPVVILHGFTGSTKSMHGVAAELSSTRRIVSVDLIGHGASDAPVDLLEYSMKRCAEQIKAVLDELKIEAPDFVGYSMGGRAALAFCSLYPERARSALLVGASAGLVDAAARSARICEDEALADRILSEGLASFVDDWMSKSIFASQARLGEKAISRFRDERMRNRPLGLALSLRGMGTGAMTPIDLNAVTIPICFVTGEEDEKFCAIAREFNERLENVRCEIVSAAGHAAHLENPSEFGRVARSFFGDVDAGNE